MHDHPTGGRYSHMLAIQVRTTGKGMVFKPFSLVYRNKTVIVVNDRPLIIDWYRV